MDVGTSLPTFVVVCVLDGSYSNRGAIRGDKTIGVIIYIYILYIYIYMEISQRNSLRRYLYLKLFLSSFFFYKIGE
jgi:hypothetical protein